MAMRCQVLRQGFQYAPRVGNKDSWRRCVRPQTTIRYEVTPKNLPETGSNERTLFIFPRLRINSSCTGTPPPTNPVFPPCGTIPIRRSLHHFTMSLTSCVVRGRSTVVDFPWYLFIQSLLNPAMSDGGRETGGSVDKMEEGDKIFEK